MQLSVLGKKRQKISTSQQFLWGNREGGAAWPKYSLVYLSKRDWEEKGGRNFDAIGNF